MDACPTLLCWRDCYGAPAVVEVRDPLAGPVVYLPWLPEEDASWDASDALTAALLDALASGGERRAAVLAVQAGR